MKHLTSALPFARLSTVIPAKAGIQHGCRSWIPACAGMTGRILLGLTAMVLGAAPAFAQDRADIDGTKIIGNRELPKVLYIVPWKKPVPSELAGRPPTSVLDEALAPIDRDVFRRQVKYDTQLLAPAQAAAPAPQSPNK
ncbi:MAG TPA: hypothetical protein VHQ87_16130 [Rhizobacter sp.]|nr:hypothetical protein [Rhizobacter sp.]